MLKLNQDAYRPKPFYFISNPHPDQRADDASLSREAIRESLSDLKSAGYGGCVVFNKSGFSQEEWLGPKWFQTVRYFAEESLPLGLDIWVNDGYDFPPGDAGGRIQELAPHLKQQRLAPGADGKVEVKEVSWGFPAFEEPESSRLFIEIVYEGHKRELGDLFGRGIVGFFSDADNRRMPHGVLAGTYFPWSGNFAAEFKKDFGYDITPHLPDVLRKKSCQAAVDYWLHAGRLYQRWFANNHEWCRKNNLKYTFHSGDSGPFTTDETVRSSIFAEGDSFGMHSHSDFPGTDHELRTLNGGTPFKPGTLWFNERARWGEPMECRSPAFNNLHGDVRAKLASSIAFLDGRAGAMCELFAASNWSVETDDLRRIAVWQIMQGINFLIPHAVHHRVFGFAKYFAPPEFLRCGVLRTSLRQLNDHLSELCAIASQGELLAPVALLDATEAVWRDHRPRPRFFELCVKLNRLPQGYVIAPLSKVVEGARQFKVAVNPGLELSTEDRKRLAKAGVTVLEAEELPRIAELVPPESGYTGSGSPHFMRRKVEGGEILMVANIEDAAEIEGVIKHAGESHTVALSPGEVAIFAPGFLRCRAPRRATSTIRLPTHAKVSWDRPNTLTIFRWEDASGKAMDNATTAKCGELLLRWRNLEAIPSPRLLASVHNVKSCALDGNELLSGRRRLIFDDEYLEFPLEGAEAPGEHVLALRCDNYAWTSPSYLEGDFDCEVIGSDAQTPGIDYYNFKLSLPTFADITLKRRRQTLVTSRTWAEQGQPFYSGKATYHFELDIPKDFKRPVLRLGKVHCRAELTLNGNNLGSLPFPPYEFDLSGFTGKCSAALTVENTLGNWLDGYGSPSGLAEAPELLST